MSQNMPVVIPNSTEDRMLTSTHTQACIQPDTKWNSAFQHMDEFISLMEKVTISHIPRKRSGEGTHAPHQTTEMMPTILSQKERCHRINGWKNTTKGKKELLCINLHGIWENADSKYFVHYPESTNVLQNVFDGTVTWHTVLSLKFQKFSTTSLISAGLLLDYKTLNFTKSFFLLTITPLLSIIKNPNIFLEKQLKYFYYVLLYYLNFYGLKDLGFLEWMGWSQKDLY